VARIDIPAGDGGDAVMVWTLQPELSKAVHRLTEAAYHKSILPPRVREAARLRIAQLNECPVCGTFRAESIRAQGLTEDFYAHVAEWRDFPGYDERERLAMEYAERFVTDHKGIDDAFFDRLRVMFSDAEVLDLTMCMAHFLGLGRLLQVIGIDETCVLDV
jgi:AhpD family alkylhydroperoxidase